MGVEFAGKRRVLLEPLIESSWSASFDDSLKRHLDAGPWLFLELLFEGCLVTDDSEVGRVLAAFVVG